MNDQGRPGDEASRPAGSDWTPPAADRVCALVGRLLWDSNRDPAAVYRGVADAKDLDRAGWGPPADFVRMLERLTWYQLLELFGADWLRARLTREVISRLWRPELRTYYERVLCILHGEALPSSGWDPAYRQGLRRTLLSDRWYGNLEGVL